MRRTLKKLGSLLLTASMVLALLPVPARAVVTDTNDWPIFQMSEYDNPETQEVVLQQMLQSSDKIAAPWGTIVQQVIQQQKGGSGLALNEGPSVPYQQLSGNSTLVMKSSASAAYDEAANNAINAISGFSGYYDDDLRPTSDYLRARGDDIDALEAEGPAFARYQLYSSQDMGNWYGAKASITIQLFYDFQVEGLSDRFETPDFEIGETITDLKSKGITYGLGGGSDSYTVKAENYNDFSNTVQKSYTYEKSTATSTEVSSSYSKDWTEETTVGVDIKLPFVNLVGGKVEQKVGYSYGISKTYSSSQSDTYTQSISDTIEVPLPPHTGIDIDVNIIDTTTSIPYTGAVRITYKTMVVYAAGIVVSDEGSGEKKNTGGTFSFGNETYTAIQDLDRRIINADVNGYDPDGLNLRASNGLMSNSAFVSAANTLRSGQPYSPYGGIFNYTSKGTTITPRKVVPLYAADRFLPDNEEITLYEQQSQRLDGIKLSALNAYDVPYYGFNARLDGTWTVVDEAGQVNTDYAEITTDRNGHPVLKALAPTEDAELYLRYQPDTAKVSLTPDYMSETILLKIKPMALSDVTLTGSFDDVILDDGSNTADVSNLTLTAKDIDGNPFTPAADAIKWFAEEEGQGIEIDPDSGEIDFDQDGTYQIYAVVNETESNRISLTVLPARQLEEITIEGEIPTLIWDDAAKNTFDLDGIACSGLDQYGHDYPVTGLWALGSDGIEDEKLKIAKTQDDTLTGLKAGSDTLWLRQNIGDAESPSYVQSNPISFTVRDAPYPQILVVSGAIPELYYNSDTARSFLLTNLGISCFDQYGELYTLDPAEYIWTPGKADHVSVTDNVLTGLVVGSDQLTLSYPTKVQDAGGNSLGTISAAPLNVTVRAIPYVNELYQGDPIPLIREGDAFDLASINLLARDQYGKSIGVPSDLQWSLADNNPTSAAIEDGKLTVAAGETAYASWSDVILEVSSPSTNRTAKNVTVRVRQQPILTTLVASVSEDFTPKWEENAILSEYFTAAGFDQYGDSMTAVPGWNSSNPDAVSLAEGVLTFRQEDGTSVITASVGSVVSNGITVTVPGTPRVTSVTVDGAPASVDLNARLALSGLTASVFDQYEQEIDAAALAAYPATIRWTLEKGVTDAAISDGTVRFGGKTGVMTLICAVVNADSNVLAQKRLDIRVGSLVKAISPAAAEMSASGGDNVITLTGERLINGLTVAVFDAEGNPIPELSAATSGTATKQQAILTFPKNESTDAAASYIVKFSYDGLTFEAVPAAAVTINKVQSGGGGGGGSGSASPGIIQATISGAASGKTAVSVKGKVALAALATEYASMVSDGGQIVITLPEIADATAYSVDIPLSALAAENADGSVTVQTPVGAARLHADLLSGTQGQTACITLKKLNAADLSDKAKEAVGTRPALALSFAVDGKAAGWEAPVTVSIPYTPDSAERSSTESLILWTVDGNTLSCVPGGFYDAGQIRFPAAGTGVFAVGYHPVSFTDVVNTAWYAGSVAFLAARGITDGATATTFDPNAALSRGQFITMLLRAYEIAPDADPSDNFSDAGDTFYTGYLAAAKRLGISNGVGDNRFAPDAAITRQEMFTLLYNALKVIDALPGGDSGKAISDFADSSSVASYAQEAMAYLVESGIVGGNNGYLLPEATTTRAQMAQVLYNLMNE